MPRSAFAWLLVPIALAFPPTANAQDPEGPSRQELSSAEHYLEKFEQQVARAKGAQVKLGYEANETLKRVRALKETYPDDAKVEELYQRTRRAVLASSGEAMEIKEEMLAYRKNGERLRELFFDEARREYDAYRETILAAEGTITKPFPAPSHREFGPEVLDGKYVILDDFVYPSNQFYDFGREFVFVGTGSKGYWFVDIGNRRWLGAYEALKRYRRFIANIPEGVPWTLIGRIDGIELLVPDASQKKVGAAHWGFRVVPEAIWVEGHTFAVVDDERETGGRFAGEDQMEAIKGPLYTVREIPNGVSPERLVEIYATAIKEKNFALFLDCIDPARKATPTALSLIRYHWDLHQQRFAELYCHATVDPERTQTMVLKGFDETDDDKGFFLTEEEKAALRERSEPLVEEAIVWTRAWTDRGAQYGSLKPHHLRRYEKERWYINVYSDQY